MSRTSATNGSRTQAEHDAPPAHGDIIVEAGETVGVIDSIQRGLFGDAYHNNVHDVADLKGAVWHVERAPKYDKVKTRAWRPCPHRRKPVEELD